MRDMVEKDLPGSWQLLCHGPLSVYEMAVYKIQGPEFCQDPRVSFVGWRRSRHAVVRAKDQAGRRERDVSAKVHASPSTRCTCKSAMASLVFKFTWWSVG